MRIKKGILALAFAGMASWAAPVAATAETTVVKVFDEVVFYDGYNGKIFDADLDDGITRFSNSRYAVKLDTKKFMEAVGNLRMRVTIGALCDNYDRIGNVSLAFVPKGQESYGEKEVDRIELTRFITPFMNMNRSPKEVPYLYEIPNVSHIFRDADLNAKYDFWLEFEVFGVPYAANTQVKGCEGRSDVFAGTLAFEFESTPGAGLENGNVVVPIYIKTPEHYGNINFNNYKEQATDTLGVTTRTWHFNVPEDVEDAYIYLIMSNHGADVNGEEYNRRHHIVYYDGEVVLSYMPGGVSCEPYRIYNTQPNGIYNSFRSEASWKATSNWCPGQAVPIREIHLGAVKKGDHSFMIRVPDAKFFKQDGDFRPSIYFHGVTSGELESSVDQVWFDGPGVEFSLSGRELSFSSDERVSFVTVHTYDGRRVLAAGALHSAADLDRIDLSSLEKGVYLLTFFTADGRSTARKLII